MPTRHLDLGCGPSARNPYRADELFAIDLSMPEGLDAAHFRRCNLVLEPIPFGNQSFDSVSAYDFLEHVPRILPTADGAATRFPFVELMNEIYRVLRPGGYLYAVTPGYPRAEAFADPTHVNIVTAHTHRYFTEPEYGARMYGFEGRFRALRVRWMRKKLEFEPLVPGPRHAARRFVDVLMRRRAHLLWEFEALP